MKWTPLTIGLAGLGAYLLYRELKKRGALGDDTGYGVKTPPPPTISPEMVRVLNAAYPPVKPAIAQPAGPTFWQQVKAVPFMTYQPGSPVSAPTLSRTAATPQYEMAKVDFSIEDKPESPWQRMARRGAEKSVQELERQAEQDRRYAEQDRETSQWQKLARRGAEKSVQELERQKEVERKVNKAVDAFSGSIKADTLSIEASDSDYRVLQAEYSLEKDPVERAKLAQALREMGELNASERARVARKINSDTEFLVAAAHDELRPDLAAKAEQKIRQERDRILKVKPAPVSMATFTPTQRAFTSVSAGEDDIFP